MAVRVQRTPMRASTHRGITRAILILGGIAGVLTAIIISNVAGLLVAPAAWFIFLNALQVWYPEPAIDEWDKLPRHVRVAMVKDAHPAALALGGHDRDLEIRRLWTRRIRGR